MKLLRRALNLIHSWIRKTGTPAESNLPDVIQSEDPSCGSWTGGIAAPPPQGGTPKAQRFDTSTLTPAREEPLVPLRPESCSFEMEFEARPYWLFDSIHIQVRAADPIAITAFSDGMCILQTAAVVSWVIPEQIMLLGLHRARAERSVKFIINCRSPFGVYAFSAQYMRPDFKREQNANGEMMIVFKDPFYEPVPETMAFGPGNPHHRKIYGPGKDVAF